MHDVKSRPSIFVSLPWLHVLIGTARPDAILVMMHCKRTLPSGTSHRQVLTDQEHASIARMASMMIASRRWTVTEDVEGSETSSGRLHIESRGAEPIPSLLRYILQLDIDYAHGRPDKEELRCQEHEA